MDTLLCNDDGDVIIGTYQPSNTLLSLSADRYTAGSATWSDQSGNGLNFTVSTNTSLKGTDADGFPYMNFGGSYGIAKRIVSSALTNITAPTTGKYTIFCVTQMLGTTINRTLIRGSSADHQVYVNNATNNLGLYDNSGSNFVDSGFDITTAMANSRNLLVWELSTSSPIYKFQLNESGTDSTITSATNYTLPFCCIGGYHNVSTVITTSSQYWGNIYEFIVYDGVFSPSERAYVAEYLTHKWDISSKLPSSFTSTHGIITLDEIGTFDLLDSSVYTQAVGAYALRRLFGAYTGAQVRLRRSTNNEETDVYFDKYGYPVNFDVETWLEGGTGYVVTWYDQSSGANHVTQTTTTSQPVIVMSGDKPYIRFQGKIMTGPNVFGSSTITTMHLITALRDNVRSNNYFISLNGTNTANPGRFFIHAPYGNGTWYWDPGSSSTDRASGATSTLGAKTVFSGYKSSINGFRLNGGVRRLSSGSTTATVTGGLRLGTSATDHSIYELLIFSSQLSDSVESFIEQNM